MSFISVKLVLLGLLVSSYGATDAVTPDEAKEIARQKVIYFSNNLKEHTPIHPDLLKITEFRRSSDGDGWIVKLSEQDCTYMIFVGDQGDDVESTGVSNGCFKDKK